MTVTREQVEDHIKKLIAGTTIKHNPEWDSSYVIDEEDTPYLQAMLAENIALRAEVKALERYPDISKCDKGHFFRTIASHPAKSEREWYCPNCLVETLALFEARIKELEDKADAEMLRVKACEQIAEGDEGWEVLRNECPSTVAVALLRDSFAANNLSLREELRRKEDYIKALQVTIKNIETERGQAKKAWEAAEQQLWKVARVRNKWVENWMTTVDDGKPTKGGTMKEIYAMQMVAVGNPTKEEITLFILDSNGRLWSGVKGKTEEVAWARVALPGVEG